MKDLQLDASGNLRHFISIEGLPKETLERILDTADSLNEVAARSIKKVPILRGKTVVTLFFEPSTRTRTTFELAAKRLSADVININVAASSATKGESLLDTLRTLEAMHVDLFVVRHNQSGSAAYFAENAAPGVSIINAGDGRMSHPTQAMLDCLTIRRHKGGFRKLVVTVVGDVLHSRVARSLIQSLHTLEVAEIRVVAPDTLRRNDLENLGIEYIDDMDEAVTGADVIYMLRLQKERMNSGLIRSTNEYYRDYGLSMARVKRAKAGAIIMHPGPMNRGVEIASEVADGPQSVILEQVSNGLAVRMAVMALTIGSFGSPQQNRS